MIQTDVETATAAAAVIVWLRENGAGIRPKCDAGMSLALSMVPPDDVTALLRNRNVRRQLVEWAGFAALRWPVAWSRATGFSRPWMMEQSRLFLDFDAVQAEAHAVDAKRTPEPGCTVELMDLLAVGRVSRNE